MSSVCVCTCICVWSMDDDLLPLLVSFYCLLGIKPWESSLSIVLYCGVSIVLMCHERADEQSHVHMGLEQVLTMSMFWLWRQNQCCILVHTTRISFIKK